MLLAVSDHAEIGFYVALAAVSTAMFLVQLALIAFGMDHHSHAGLGHDVGNDMGNVPHHTSSDVIFKLFTVQSILALLMGFGWAGAVSRAEWDWGSSAALAFGLAIGGGMMIMSAVLTHYMKRLNSEPRFDPTVCVGHHGTVYMSIPGTGQGAGQVRVEIEGANRILEAQSAGQAIPAFSIVKILAVDQTGVLTVELVPTTQPVQTR